jgi:hypothetical protein
VGFVEVADLLDQGGELPTGGGESVLDAQDLAGEFPADERNVAGALDPARFDLEIVHLGQSKSRLPEAEQAGVKSVPALVLGGAACHINFGAGLEALR